MEIPVERIETDYTDDDGTPAVVVSYTIADSLRPHVKRVIRRDGGWVAVIDDTSLTAERLAVITDVVVSADVKADTLTDAEIVKRAPLFPPWRPGVAVAVGDVLQWDGTLVEVIQAHETQADWVPDTVPALFKVHRKAGKLSPWIQPTGAHDAYNVGDRVTFEGATYESLIDANTWSPTANPAGWTLIA